MNHKHDALWSLKKYTLCTSCTLILFNHFHLTVASNLILIQSEFWVPKCYHAHSKVFFLVFKVFKRCHQDFSILHIIILVIHHFFLPKWITFNVLSLFFSWNYISGLLPLFISFSFSFVWALLFFIFIWDLFHISKGL